MREGKPPLLGSTSSNPGRERLVQDLPSLEGMRLAQIRPLVIRARNRLSVLVRIGGPTVVAVARLTKVLVAERIWHVPPRLTAQHPGSGQKGALG
jgi:hypothetical protein